MPEEKTIISEESEKNVDEKSGEEDGRDPLENLAKEMGWQGKNDFKGDEKNYVDAGEYIRKGHDIQDQMRKSLKDQKTQLSKMSGSLTELKRHNERVFKAEVNTLKKELSTLKSQKKIAIEDGDVEKVDKIDEQIDTVKESMTTPEPEVKKSENDEFDRWVKDNKWYEENKEMAAYADTQAARHEGAPFGRVATLVTKQVQEMFPDKFPGLSPKKNNALPATSRVEAGARKAVAVKFTKADLSDSQKSIMSQFVRQGIMSEKDYIEDLSKIAGGAT